MAETVADTCRKIAEATGPDDIFESLGNNNQGRAQRLKRLQEEYERLSGILAVDTSNVEAPALKKIKEAKITLDELYVWAKSKIVADDPVADNQKPAQTGSVPSLTNEIKISTKKRDYYITEGLSTNDLSVVYKGYYLEDTMPVDVAVKITRNPSDNAFAKREATALELLYSAPNNEGRQLKHLPKLLDQFTTSDNQRANILTTQDGYDLNAVKEKYGTGVDRKHMVWMLNRLLSVAGYAHSRGVIHGNITPANLTIRPRDHNLWLLDWGCSMINSAGNGAKFFVFNEEFSAPEIEKRPELPPMAQCASQAEVLYLGALFSADIYSIGKCMIYILGGDIKTNEVPDTVEMPLRRFLESLVLESPLQRPRDAWETHGQLRRIITQLWGKREFLEFRM